MFQPPGWNRLRAAGSFRPAASEGSVILTHGTGLQAPISELSNIGRTVAVMDAREANECEEIVGILKVTKGRVAGPDGAAARMDIKRVTLISRIKKLGIEPRKVL
jgi:formate hydrogenlyase transcriptional activator